MRFCLIPVISKKFKFINLKFDNYLQEHSGIAIIILKKAKIFKVKYYFIQKYLLLLNKLIKIRYKKIIYLNKMNNKNFTKLQDAL